MNLPSGQEQRKNIALEERLSKLAGRHLRLLNRISTKLAREKSYATREDAKQELMRFMKNPQNHQDTPLLMGVRSALYSKLDESIKNTRFDNANLGLVITDGDVQTNYDIDNVRNFMTYGQIENTDFTGHKKPAFSGINIINSRILRNGQTVAATIGKNSTIIGSDLLEQSNNYLSKIGENTMISYSKIANHSTNEGTSFVKDAIISSSMIGNYSTNYRNVFFAENATLNETKDLKTLVSKYATQPKEKNPKPLYGIVVL